MITKSWFLSGYQIYFGWAFTFVTKVKKKKTGIHSISFCCLRNTKVVGVSLIIIRSLLLQYNLKMRQAAYGRRGLLKIYLTSWKIKSCSITYRESFFTPFNFCAAYSKQQMSRIRTFMWFFFLKMIWYSMHGIFEMNVAVLAVHEITKAHSVLVFLEGWWKNSHKE